NTKHQNRPRFDKSKQQTMFRTLTFLFFIFIVTSVSAQQYVDLVNVTHTQRITKQNSASVQNPKYAETTLDLLIPMPIGKKKTILTGFNIERTSTNLLVDQSNLFYGSLLKLGVNINHSNRFNASYILLPKIASDFSNTNTDHFQLGGLFLAKLKQNDVFKWKFGCYANTEHFGLLVVPILGFYYQKNNLEINATLPINAEVLWNIHDTKFALGGRFDGINRSYMKGMTPLTYIEKNSNEVAAFAQLKMKNGLFRCMIGSFVGQRISQFSATDKVSLALPLYKINNDRSALENNISTAAFIKFSFIYRLPTQA
ncbi:MAG: hypothetical protein NWR83_03305, partial [Salibacteraceae bacterium]|nr:hypothetical protein [Salibacteraceae bacterium]